MSQKRMRRTKIKNIQHLRAEFRKRLVAEMSQNPALAMLAIETYSAFKHRRHIHAIWELLGFHFRDAHDAYNKQLFGKHLCGKNEIFHSLYFACRPLYDEFFRKIPEQLALGDALSVAYAILRKQ